VEEAARARFLAEFTLSTQSEIPSLRSGQALRCAQDDSEGLGMTSNFKAAKRLGCCNFDLLRRFFLHRRRIG